MNFQQLRIIRETVRQNFNLTKVADALFTSQSGVSKHIKDLEEELGIEIFDRKGKRFLGLTEPGKELVVAVERILQDSGNIKRLAEQFSRRDEGQLTVATTHTQARYALPRVVAEFKRAFPKVHLVLLQASPDELVRLLLNGEADIGIATEAVDKVPELISFPYYSWHHAVIAPAEHPIHDLPLTVANLSKYPIVTYHHGFTGRNQIDNTFSKLELVPDIVMSALDADVIKTYVRLGLGVGIVASMAIEEDDDAKDLIVHGTPLFEQQTTCIAIRQGHYLRSYGYQFIELCSAKLTEQYIKEELRQAGAA